MIELRDSGITLYPEARFVPFSQDATFADVKQAIYQHVAQQLRAWGRPDEFREFVPVLEFNVRPDGLDRYYDLRLAMIRSGLEIRRRLVGWKDDLEFREFFGEGKPAESARQPTSLLRR